jgi:DNA-binding LacI/PurR family transcriptional regulator
LFDVLRKAIRGGDFQPGAQLPTEFELMQHYGVSRTTVSRTLRDLETEGLVRRRRGSGSFVQEPKASASQSVFALLVPTMEPHSVFVGVYQAMLRALEKQNATVVLDTSRDPMEAVNRGVTRGVKGVFCVPVGLSPEGTTANRSFIATLAEKHIPVVLLDRDVTDFPQRSHYDLVGVDNLRGGYLLGSHLIEVGCRRPLFLTEEVAYSSARARGIGFRAAVEQHGLEPRVVALREFTAETVLGAVRTHDADGIACDNDTHAALTMRHLLNAGLRIPQQVRLAGFDDTPTASLLTVPLTTIRQPTQAMALRAISVMQDRIAHPNIPPVHVAVDCELVIRESTRGHA